MKQSFKNLLDNYEHLNYLPIFDRDGKPGLTLVDPALLGEYIIITVRDPLCAYDDDPATQIAARLDKSVLAGRSGMFLTYTGYYEGAHISVVSGGSGCPEAELILNEFMRYSNVSTFIRIGGAGSWSEDVHAGDVVIASGAVRDDGVSRSYVCPQYPAVASYEVVCALAQAAADSGHPYHVGIIRSGDSEYCGWGKPSVDGYVQPEHLEIIDYYNRAGVLCVDRETSAIICLPQLFGRRGGSIVSMGESVLAREPFQLGAGHEAAIEIGLKGLAILSRMDAQKKKHSSRYWIPSFGIN